MTRVFSALRGVTAARNAELIQYQESLRRIRQKYRAELSSQPTKLQQQAIVRKVRAAKRDSEWQKYLLEVKEKLVNPHSELLRDRHQCRPVRKIVKEEEVRLTGQLNLSNQLSEAQAIKRKHITMLSRQLEGFVITKETLDKAIKQAIEKPTNFNVKPEALIAERKEAKAALSRIQVPKESKVFAVGAHFAHKE